MAVTQAQIDALEAVINSGVASVRFGERQTQYQDLEKLRERLREMKAEFARQSGGSGSVLVSTSKGFR